MIATDHHLGDILFAICQMLDAEAPDTFCSILLTDAEGRHLLSGAAPSLPAEYSEAIHGMAIGPQEGTCGTAAFRRELVVTEDIARDPNWGRFRSLALGHNLRSCWSVPLLSPRGNVLGTFALYRNRVYAPDESQIQRLACAAQLAVIAIRHERDGQRLEKSEQQFRSLFTSELEGDAVTDELRKRDAETFCPGNIGRSVCRASVGTGKYRAYRTAEP